MSILAIHVDALIKPRGYAPDLDRWAYEAVEDAGGLVDVLVGTTLGSLRARLTRYAMSHETIIVIGTEGTREQTTYVQSAAFVSGFGETMSAIVRDEWDSGAGVRGLQAVVREACFGPDECIDLVVDGDLHFIENVRRDALVHLLQPVTVHKADPVLGLIDSVLPAPEPQPL